MAPASILLLLDPTPAGRIVGRRPSTVLAADRWFSGPYAELYQRQCQAQEPAVARSAADRRRLRSAAWRVATQLWPAACSSASRTQRSSGWPAKRCSSR